MTIGVLSDTHSLGLPAALLDRFKTVDLIIHAGDVCDAATLRLLRNMRPVKAVQGNMDDAAVKKQLPAKEVMECGGVKIGITHGHLFNPRDPLKGAMEAFRGEKMDIVVFGHSHVAYSQKIGGTLYFNPGSPNDSVRAKFFSYGLISIEAGKIKAEIVKI